MMQSPCHCCVWCLSFLPLQAVNSLSNLTQEGGQLLQSLWHNVTRVGEHRLSAIVEMMQTAAVDAQMCTWCGVR